MKMLSLKHTLLPTGQPMQIREISPQEAFVLCQDITQDLPEYFGLPEANTAYFQGMKTRHSMAAFVDNNPVGLITVDYPYPKAASLYWMGIKRAYQNQGIGKALWAYAENVLWSQGIGSATVETLSPLEADANYAKTYGFYKACGFEPLFDLKPMGYLFKMVYMHKPLKSSFQTPPSLHIRPFENTDIPLIVSAFAKAYWHKPEATFQTYYQEQIRHERLLWLAFLNNTFAGYVTLKWQSDYLPFQNQGIPEIKDLNVLPDFRHQGIGSSLLAIAEDAVREKVQKVGLGVGLYADYGPAQKLYIQRGYIPDGKGVTSYGVPVIPGTKVMIDDDILMWLIKDLA